MDAGRRALVRVLQEQSLGPVMERGVKPFMFPDREVSEVFTFILDFHAKHKAVPSPGLVESIFPGLHLPFAPDPLGYYVDEVLKQFVRSKTAEVLMERAPVVVSASDPEPSMVELRQELNRLQGLLEVHRLSTPNDGAASRMDRYLQRKGTQGLLGIPTAFASLDAMTLGWEPHTYNGVAARPKTGKTWWLLKNADAAWAAGYKVLFCNKELPDEKMNDRLDALRAGVSYSRFRRGKLLDPEVKKLEEYYRSLDEAAEPTWWWLNNVQTASGIAAKIEEVKPDLVVIDGAYLLRDETGARSSWERQMGISRSLKAIASDFPVAVLISIQLNRDGDQAKSKRRPTLSDLAGSDAFGQDVDTMFGLQQDDDARAAKELEVVPLATRESEGGIFRHVWDLDRMDFRDLGTNLKLVQNDDEDFVTFDEDGEEEEDDVMGDDNE